MGMERVVALLAAHYPAHYPAHSPAAAAQRNEPGAAPHAA